MFGLAPPPPPKDGRETLGIDIFGLAPPMLGLAPPPPKLALDLCAKADGDSSHPIDRHNVATNNRLRNESSAKVRLIAKGLLKDLDSKRQQLDDVDLKHRVNKVTENEGPIFK